MRSRKFFPRSGWWFAVLDNPEFIRGRAGEMTVAKLLRERGWYVVPSYDYSGANGDKAPKLTGLRDGFAIPDLDVARDGKRIWVEVKVKAGPTYHRITQVYEHGISLRLFGHYRRVEAITGCVVWLFILEEDSMLLRIASLQSLGDPRTYDGKRMGRDGMAFWPQERFKEWAKIARTEAA